MFTHAHQRSTKTCERANPTPRTRRRAATAALRTARPPHRGARRQHGLRGTREPWTRTATRPWRAPRGIRRGPPTGSYAGRSEARTRACPADRTGLSDVPDNGSPGPAPPSRHEGTSLSAAARLGRACSHLCQDQLTLAFALPWSIGHGDLAGTSRPQQPGAKSSRDGQLRPTTPRAARAPPGHRLRAPPRRRDRAATAGVPSPRARKDRSLHRRP